MAKYTTHVRYTDEDGETHEPGATVDLSPDQQTRLARQIDAGRFEPVAEEPAPPKAPAKRTKKAKK